MRETQRGINYLQRTWILNCLCCLPGVHLEMPEPSVLYSPSSPATIYPYSMWQSQRTAVLRWTVEATAIRGGLTWMSGKMSHSEEGFSCNLQNFKTTLNKTMTNTLFGPVLHWLGEGVNYLIGLCYFKILSSWENTLMFGFILLISDE